MTNALDLFLGPHMDYAATNFNNLRRWHLPLGNIATQRLDPNAKPLSRIACREHLHSDTDCQIVPGMSSAFFFFGRMPPGCLRVCPVLAKHGYFNEAEVIGFPAFRKSAKRLGHPPAIGEAWGYLGIWTVKLFG